MPYPSPILQLQPEISSPAGVVFEVPPEIVERDPGLTFPTPVVPRAELEPVPVPEPEPPAPAASPVVPLALAGLALGTVFALGVTVAIVAARR